MGFKIENSVMGKRKRRKIEKRKNDNYQIMKESEI